jgi:hypothetical protein
MDDYALIPSISFVPVDFDASKEMCINVYMFHAPTHCPPRKCASVCAHLHIFMHACMEAWATMDGVHLSMHSVGDRD